MNKKYITVLFDGMADYPDVKGNTPMKEAFKPATDALCNFAEAGLCQTVPEGMKPGSDVANLSVMGYDPAIYYSGRSPLEALSMGVHMTAADVSYRCNLVTLSDDEPYENKTMVDYSAGEISTSEARELIEYLEKNLPKSPSLTLHAGVSYRHCLLRTDGKTGGIFTPPHDISDRKITDYLPKGEYADEMLSLMKASYELLKDCPVNERRAAKGLKKANSVWLWGEGRKPALKNFYELHGKRGAVISAVDLLKGIGIAAGMDVIEVKGATGNIDSDFDAKLAAAVKALDSHDYVYIHLEAPDECGHQGNYPLKKRAIEIIDEKIVAPLIEHFGKTGTPYKIAILPDHATPVALKTHVSDPVPYLIYDSENLKTGVKTFNEQTAASTGITAGGVELLKRLLD